MLLGYVGYYDIRSHKDLDPRIMNLLAIKSPLKKNLVWNAQQGCGKDTPNEENLKLVPNRVIWYSLAGS